MIDKCRVKGYYTFKNIDTGEIWQSKNMILSGFFNALFDQLDYTDTSLFLNYFAVGDDSTPVTFNDAELGNEIYRKIPASRSNTATKYTIKTQFEAAEANPAGGNWLEIGVYANGTATADSGTLISRSVVSVPKNENIKLLVSWTFELIEE